MSAFKVTIENFEGPIDALLQLIEKRKLPINDISLADITDDYIRFVTGLEGQSLSNTTHFIFVASTLTLIKSKSLLPTIDLSDEEEGDIESLKQRIAIFQEYQRAAGLLRSRMRSMPSRYFPKSKKQSIEFIPHETLTTKNLRDSLLGVFKEIPEKKSTKKEGSVRIAVHIEEMMHSLQERLEQALSTDFHSFVGSYTKNTSEPKEVIVYRVVGFLAMLELVKNGALDVQQDENFSSILIENI